MKNIAIILAGGSGTRLGDDLPKQFLKVAGKKIIEHTIDVFDNNDNIDEIAIVCKEEYVSTMDQLIINNGYKKVRKVLLGGKERYHSSLSAIAAYNDDDDNLIFHDAVRPLVNNRIIDDCVKALEKYDAVDVAVNATDTIIQVDKNDCIERIPYRAYLRNGQTPQCFKRGIIKKAYDIALNDPGFVTTDDCGVVRKYLPDIPVYVVKGESFNMKVTYIEDLYLLDKLFQLKTLQNIRQDVLSLNDRQLKNKVMVIFGGSCGIGAEVKNIAANVGVIVESFSRSQNSVDVTDNEQVRKALNIVNDKYGHIDFVVDTAGLLIKQPLSVMSSKDILDSVNINYIGVVNVAKESYPYLKESKGAVVFYTSSSYTRGRMLYSIYSSTKSAIVNFVQAISEEWFKDGIRVNCINPERTKTPMREKAFGIEPEGSLLDPQDVAIATINTLLSNCTGEVIDVKRMNKR